MIEFMIPYLPFPMISLYIAAGYLIWWLISRAGLIAAWLYSKPGTLNIRHYILIFIGMTPLLFEIIASILSIFAVAQGISPRDDKFQRFE